MLELELVKFIRENEDWEVKLQEKPYCLKIKRKNGCILFMYDLLSSNFSEPIVREARGIILEEGTWRILCFPFTKMFNYGEFHAEETTNKILSKDISKVKFYEKIDGSIIKFWNYNGEVVISTNGMIDAADAEPKYIEGTEMYDNFLQVVDDAIDRLDFDIRSMMKNELKNHTVMFELTSPSTRVIVNYPNTEMKLIGLRDNRTGLEISIDKIHTKFKPKEYSFKTLKEASEFASKLSADHEGFMVCDDEFNRVKMKSLKYVTLAHIVEGGVVDKAVLKLILLGEKSEFLTYFPIHKNKFDLMESVFHEYVVGLRLSLLMAHDDIENNMSRKDYAVKYKENPGFNHLMNRYTNKLDLNTAVLKSMPENIQKDEVIKLVIRTTVDHPIPERRDCSLEKLLEHLLKNPLMRIKESD